MSNRYLGGFISATYNPLLVPNAPTIGTATEGISSLSVTFTAPSNVGGSAITSYVATAKKTSDGTLFTASGASSPITITSLTSGTYMVTIVAVNSYGPSASSAASNSVTPFILGSALGGGYFAGQISTAGNSIADYNLVVGPVASAQSTLQWKTSATSTAGTDSNIDGPANSTAMNNATHPAAQFCEAVTTGGFTDWYMPARYELEICYYNLKPSTTANVDYGTSGINPNAVPARATTYTASIPAQTTAADFRVTTGAEAFLATFYYWSSTQHSATYGWTDYFSMGYQNPFNKTSSRPVRAIRRVAV
jgi:hypothetical protein